jgi:hypothetical protein
MTDHGLLAMLSSYGFEKVGDIRLTRNVPNFDLSVAESGQGFVYVWVEMAGTTGRVVYVGKAGRTVHDRCKQHAGGFRNSTTGHSLAAQLRTGFKKGNRYEIHARKCPVREVCGERGISMASVEELAFIQKLVAPLFIG